MPQKGFSGSTLKLIAIITMLIDHIGAAVIARLLIAGQGSEMLYKIYYAMRAVGRVAFPIFCFLLVEGFFYTGSRKKYALRLFGFALLSEIPFDLAFSGKILEFGYQNVFFTLLIGLLTIMLFDEVVKKQEWHPVLRSALLVIITFGGMGAAYLLHTDYDAKGVLAILVFYMTRQMRGLQIVAGCLAFCWELPAIVAFIPIAFYNGKRGWNIKYLFYAFYPVHLLVLYLICVGMGTAQDCGGVGEKERKRVSMEISKETRKRLMQIIAFGILLYCGMEHFDVVIGAVDFVLGIVMPFLVGGAIAFVINVPMKSIERHLFAKNGKLAKWRRPVAYLLTLALVIGIITLALVVVIPELGNTISMVVQQVPVAVKAVQKWLTDLPDSYPALAPAVAELNIDWSSLADSIVTFVQNFAAGVVSSGVGIFSGIVSGVVTFVIAFTFSIYVLFQKERLARQAKQILYAVFPEKTTEKILSVAALSNQVFSSFLSGQCVEAVILGTLFVITMSILGMPYAMLTGIVIAITALIPIFGAFIGCVIGMLLIVMVDPVQAVWFLVLFLVLQQIEGNLIYPHVVGSSVGLPSIWVLVAVTVGGNMFGIGYSGVHSALLRAVRAVCHVCEKKTAGTEVPESRWNTPSGGAAAADPAEEQSCG